MKKNAPKMAMAILTLLLALLFAVKLTSLQGEAMGLVRYAKAFGYAALPLIFAALIASVVNWGRKPSSKPWYYGNRFMWLAGFLGCLLLLLAVFTESIPSKQALANDALTILRLDGYIASIAGICGKSASNAASFSLSAGKWGERNQPDLDLVKDALNKAGGISDREKRLIAKLAMAFARNEITRYADKNAHCRKIEEDINNGAFDVAKNKDTGPALRRIQNSSSP